MRVLIAYGTKYGSTEKCATLLAQKIVGEVDLVNLKVKEIEDITEYDKIIIGTSVYAGRVFKEVTKFCKENLDLLKKKKVSIFTCGMLDGQKAEEQFNNCFPNELLQSVVAKGCLGGEFNFDKMGFADKIIAKMVSKAQKSNTSTISKENIDKFAKLVNER